MFSVKMRNVMRNRDLRGLAFAVYKDANYQQVLALGPKVLTI